jgi:hypothetical protein
MRSPKSAFLQPKAFFMRKISLSLLLAVLLPLTGFSADVPVQKPTSEAPKQELKEPFNVMTSTEQTETGINKLSPAEQNALAQWWNRKKNAPSKDITKELTLSEITDGGKTLVLSDGAKLYLSSSVKKKIAKWNVGDKIGIGASGRKGSLTIYHMATGRKIKVKREQAPRQTETPAKS